MSAAQTIGTPAAAPAAPTAPAATEAPTAAANGLDAILGDLSEQDLEAAGDGADAALEALTGDAAPDAEPETPETQPDKAARLDDDVIFSDKALETREGVLKAKGRIRDLQKLQHQKYLELKGFEKRVVKRHEKLRNQVQKYVTGKQNDELLLGNVRSNLKGLHSGDPDTILTALGNLTGQDGLRAYELLTSRIVNRGQSKLDPQVQAIVDGLQNELRELKGGLNQREELGKVEHLNQQISSHAQRIQQQVLSSTTTPHLARIMRDDPHGLTELIVNEITKSNGTIPASQLFASMEQEIRAHLETGSGAPQGDGGGPAPKQPSQVQRSPGQSIGPSRASSSNPRTPTEEESLRALADDPEFMSLLGI